MLKKPVGNLLTGSKNVTVETQAEVQFDQPNLKQIQINVHHVMPVRIKQKTKRGHPDSKSKSKCMYLQYHCITLPKKPIFFIFYFFGKQKIGRGRQQCEKPILLATIVHLFLLDIALYSQQCKTYLEKRLLLTYFIPKIRPYNTT